jgi:hypothetical protein
MDIDSGQLIVMCTTVRHPNLCFGVVIVAQPSSASNNLKNHRRIDCKVKRLKYLKSAILWLYHIL